MRRAVDDVTSTPKAHRLLALITFVVMAAITASLPVEPSAPDPASASSSARNGTSNGGKSSDDIAIELRVLYICDKTSADFCPQSNTAQAQEDCDHSSYGSNRHRKLPPMASLPRGCIDMTSDKDSHIHSNPSASSNFTDQERKTTGSQENIKDPLYLCWRLEDGGLVIQRNLSDDGQDTLLVQVSYRTVSGTLIHKMRSMDLLEDLDNTDVIITIGDTTTVQVAATAGEWRELPVLGYITSYPDDRKPIQGRTYLSLNPDPEAQGRALTQVIGRYNMKQTAVLVEETRLADGFLSGVRQITNARRQDIFFIQPLSPNDTSDVILEKLVDISTVGWKVILLHASPSLMLRVVTSALSTRLYKTGHAWFLSEAAYTRDPDVLRHLPDGLLAIDSFWYGGTPGVMATSLERVLEAVTCLLLSQSNTVPYSSINGSDWLRDLSKTSDHGSGPLNSQFNTFHDAPANYLKYLKASSINNSTNWGSSSSNDISHRKNVSITSLRSTFNFFDNFRRCLQHANCYCSKENSKDGANTNDDSERQYNNQHPYSNLQTTLPENQSSQIPDDTQVVPGEGDDALYNAVREDIEGVYPSNRDNDQDRVEPQENICLNYSGPAFSLVNTIRDANGELMWSRVGYITAYGERDLKTVLWPGHNIYGPSSSMVKTYRVVTRPAEPFIYVTRLDVANKEECGSNVPCLQVENSTKVLVDQAVEDFVTNQELIGELYTLHCCKGLALEMLDKLSVDLNFRYVLYFVNDTDYGTLEDGAWTGMVGDVINNVADVVIGAFSMTAERMTVMDYTEPFYKNEYALITGEDGIYVSIWAFMSPFSGQVWLCIMLSSIVAGIATSILEWHSPFGLNPKGRKRTKNYGLGSGLLMVMVLLTGHTINVKAPKSWPGKVIQNVWAGLAIFIMTSYTANLAAYLAGQSVVTTVNSVFDPELLTKKVAVMPTSAVENFVDKIHPKLGAKAKLHVVSSTEEAIQLLKKQKIDVYMDDMPLLEYALARYDDTCNVRFAGKGFGSDGYAFGLPRYSWLKIPMSNQILSYTESGYIQELVAKYLSRPRCENFLVGTANPYGLEHTGGLFIILVSAVVLSVIFLLLEHLAYHYLVPWLRRQPSESFWKRESFAFISQRVFRVVRSERLYSQKQAAQEMIKIVKQRDFTRLIQKNELQKRRIPTQKRVKTKAEVFQEITANIVSYHRQLQSTSEDPETLDGSDLDEEYFQSQAHSVGDGEPGDATLDGFNGTAEDGIHNVAFSAGSSCSTVASRRRQGYRANTMLSIDDDDNVVFVDQDDVIDEGDEDYWLGLRRKGSSKSFVLNPQGMSRDGQQRGAPRKLSDSPYPPWSRTQRSPYVLPLSYRFRKPSLGQFKASSSSPTSPEAPDSGNLHNNMTSGYENRQNPLCKKHFPRILKGNKETLNPTRLLSEGGNVTFTAEAEYPPRSALMVPDLPLSEVSGKYYYYSPTSSSVQTLSEERREFSPLSSPATPHTDEEFPGCIETSFTGGMPPLDLGSGLQPVMKKLANSPYQSQTHKDQQIEPEITSTTQAIDRDIRLDPVRLSSTDDLAQLSPVYENQVPDRPITVPDFVGISPNSSTFAPATLELGEHCENQSSSLDVPDGNGTKDRKSRKSGSPSIEDFHFQSPIAEQGNPAKMKRNNSAVFTIEEEVASRDLNMAEQKQFRRASLDSGHVNNTRRSRALDDYFKRNLRLKDNRVKSTLRRHAMSGYQSQLPVDYIDECTLEALSKEDVLILWKKSELDLEGRLHEVLARNRRLSLAIDYLTKSENSNQPEDV